MRKLFFSVFAAVAAFALASCVKEPVSAPDPAQGGEPVPVTFSLNLGNTLTKATPEGSVFDDASGEFVLYAAAFSKTNGALISTSKIGGSGYQPVESVNAKNINIVLTLSRSQDYKVVFFAMHAGAYEVNFADNNVATFTYKRSLLANDASLDAFYASVDVSSSTNTYNVTMKRPFAQLNVLVPLDNIPAGQTAFSSSMTVQAPVSFNLYGGVAGTDIQDLSFASNAIAATPVGAYKSTHKWVGMNFVLVPASGSVTVTSFAEAGMTESVRIGAVPVKVNSRTNIVGSIYSLSDFFFNLQINPVFDDEQEHPVDNGETSGGEEREDTEITIVGGDSFTEASPLVIDASGAATPKTVSLRVNGDDFAAVEAGAGGAKVTATSSNTAVATAEIKDGAVLITPKGNGKAKITVTTPAYTKTDYKAQSFDFWVEVTGISSGGGGETGGSDTLIFGDLNLENGTQYKDPFTQGNMSVQFGAGSNDGKYYTTGTGMRIYGDGWVKVSSSSKTIVKIEYTFDPTEQKDGDVVKTFVPDDASFGSVNPGTYDLATQTWTGSASSVTLTRATGTGHWRLQKIVVYYGEGGDTPPQPQPVTATLTVSPASLNLTVGQTATLTASTNSSATPTFSTSNGSVATVGADGKVTALAAGTATITVSVAAVEGAFTAASKTVPVTVTSGGGSTGDGNGTKDSPYTVAQALALTNALAPKAETADKVYIKGVISEIKDVNTGEYGNATYYISDDGTKNGQFQVFRGFYLGGAKFTAADQIKVNDAVIVYGKLKNYQNTDNSLTPEVTSSEIYSLNGVTASGGGQGGGGEDLGNPDATLTNAEIRPATVDAEITDAYPSYRDATITSASGTWTGNIAKHKDGLKFLQLRNKKGAYITSPLFTSAIQKVVVTMTSENVDLADRTLHAVPPTTTLPTGKGSDGKDILYSATEWANEYGCVRTGTEKGATVVIDFAEGSNVKQFMLIVEGGATYIDHIDVYY